MECSNDVNETNVFALNFRNQHLFPYVSVDELGFALTGLSRPQIKNISVLLKDFLIYAASNQFELKLGDLDGGQTWWWVTLMMGNLDVG